MKIIRFLSPQKQTRFGVLREQTIEEIDGEPFGTLRFTGNEFALGEVSLLAPIVPPNILCFGRNYKAHAEEGGDSIPKAPLLFLKATTSLINPGDSIVVPRIAPTKVDYEAELAVVIGRAARNVSEEDALDYVLGYTCANDVSARDCQDSDGQWARGKSFDTFCPMGPWIETELDPANVTVTGLFNGKVVQQASTSLMIFSVRYLISYVSRAMTLMPGTVLLTGTPAGCGFAQTPPLFFHKGDNFEVQIEGIGSLRNSAIEE